MNVTEIATKFEELRAVIIPLAIKKAKEEYKSGVYKLMLSKEDISYAEIRFYRETKCFSVTWESDYNYETLFYMVELSAKEVDEA